MKHDCFCERPQEPLFDAFDAGGGSVSLAQVSAASGISIRTLRDYANRGQIPGAFQVGGKNGRWRFKKKAIELWWRNQGSPHAV